MLREEAGNYSSLRRLLTRVLPLGVLLELSPSAYSREFNHGRLEVEVFEKENRAIFKNYDWMSSRARCAAWLGMYEGSFKLTGKTATVTKISCMLHGDPYCGYRLDW